MITLQESEAAVQHRTSLCRTGSLHSNSQVRTSDQFLDTRATHTTWCCKLVHFLLLSSPHRFLMFFSFPFSSFLPEILPHGAGFRVLPQSFFCVQSPYYETSRHCTWIRIVKCLSSRRPICFPISNSIREVLPNILSSRGSFPYLKSIVLARVWWSLVLMFHSQLSEMEPLGTWIFRHRRS